jgi:hypothetical protein
VLCRSFRSTKFRARFRGGQEASFFDSESCFPRTSRGPRLKLKKLPVPAQRGNPFCLPDLDRGVSFLTAERGKKVVNTQLPCDADALKGLSNTLLIVSRVSIKVRVKAILVLESLTHRQLRPRAVHTYVVCQILKLESHVPERDDFLSQLPPSAKENALV